MRPLRVLTTNPSSPNPLRRLSRFQNYLLTSSTPPKTNQIENFSEMEPYDARYDDYYAMPPPMQHAQHSHPHQQQPPPHPYPQQMQRSRSAPRYPNERPPHVQDPNYYSHYGTNGRGGGHYRQHAGPPMDQYYDENGMELAPPPPLPPHKKKKSVLKSPLTALKNALIKSTRPLRRMNSMVEPERKPKGLRRQQSMLERGVQRPYYPDEYPSYAAGFDERSQQQQQQPLPPPPSSDPYYRGHYGQQQDMMNSTYQNLESEDIYGNIGATVPRMQRPPDNGYGSYEQYDLYANRACIDLERRQAEAAAAAAANGGGRNGRRIVRRHSTTTADRNGAGGARGRGGMPHGQSNGGYDPQQQHLQQQLHPQDIYQTRQGAYMMPGAGEQRRAPSSEVMTRRRFYPGAANEQCDEATEPMYQSRREIQREMQRSHLYQSKREMQERIIQGKRDMERELSAQSSSQSERSDDRSERSERSADPNYQSRREATRTQLRDQIYQTRREALDSMAEPIYVSKRDVGRPAPIYETREESILQSRENETDEKKECKTEQVQVEINSQAPEEAPDSTLSRSDLQRSSDTVIENTAARDRQAPLVQSEIEDDVGENIVEAESKANGECDAGAESSSAAEDVTELPTAIENNMHNEGMLANETQAQNMSDDVFEATDVVTPLSPRALRAPFHISNILKRTGPPPSSPIGDSCTSIETQYTSQASLPVGPPNATSTPFSSSMSLPIAGPVQPPAASNGAVPAAFPTLPREPSTTRGFFDSNGGTLADKLWHVSLQIPPGAIPPGVRQEIYFTVSDPRMGQTVGGPPLDMENGWSN